MATGKEGKPAKKGTPDKLLEELKVAASKPNPPAEVPPRDTDKEDSGISAESIKSEREEDALIDKNIEARRATEAAAAPEVPPVVSATPTAETVEPKVIPPELEHLEEGERELYLKLPKEKQESYLAHVAEMRADEEKKRNKKESKKSAKSRAQRSKSQIIPQNDTEQNSTVPLNLTEELKDRFLAGAKLTETEKEAVLSALEKPVAEDETETPLPAVFRNIRGRPGSDELKIKEKTVSLNPEDVPEYIKGSLNDEHTPKEWREKLRELIEGAKEKIGMSERGERMKAYLAERSRTLGEKAKEYGANPEKLIRDVGEQYNKLSFKQKLLFGFGAGAGATIFAGVSTPLTLLFAGGLGIQRAGGMASMYLKFEKHLQDTVEGKSKGILGRQEWYQNIFMGSSEKQRKIMAAVMSVGYTAGMSAAIGGTIKLASESQYGEAVHDWLRHHYPFGEAGASLTGTAATDAAPAPVPTESAAGAEGPRIAAAAVAGEAAGAAVPSGISIDVEATPGHGYEYMMKRVWDGLQDLKEQGLDPNKYPEGSAARQLFDADPKSIDEVVHRIAADPARGFFNADGTSVRIDLGSHMTVGADGEIHLNEIIKAPTGAPVTPAFHPEAPINSSNDVIPVQPDDLLSAEQRNGFIAEPMNETAPARSDVSLGESAKKPAVDLTSAQDATTSSANVAPPDAVDTAPSALTPAAEHVKEFINPNKVPIDPLHGHVFGDSNGAALAYGNDFDARFNAAQNFAKDSPNTSVWVQAEKPFLDAEGVLRPYVFEVKYGGWFRGMQILGADGPIDEYHVGAIKPDTFIKQLDK